MKKSIYLDYAAATPMDGKVVKAMAPYWQQKFYNPSATYLSSRSARQDLNEARENIAKYLGAKSGEIYFTAGATEANNLAISGTASNFSDGEMLISSIEHESVIAPAELYKCNKISTNTNGIVDLSELKKKINPNTILVSVMVVNNELGTIQPIREISNLITDIRKERIKKSNKQPIYLHTDAAQAGNFFDLHVSRLGVDLMSINGGKIYGPKQTGILYVKAGTMLKPLIVGGGQERNLRSGTENVPGFIGLAKALEIAQKTKDKEAMRTRELREYFVKELAKNIPESQINGSPKHQAPHIVHVTFAGNDNERLMMELDERGVQCAVGSACSASSAKPSHVLSAVGMNDENARASLRFSFGRHTSKKDLNRTVRLLKSLVVNNR
jgi:cysteine desulfurase